MFGVWVEMKRGCAGCAGRTKILGGGGGRRRGGGVGGGVKTFHGITLPEIL